jgi:hypothetical protein
MERYGTLKPLVSLALIASGVAGGAWLGGYAGVTGAILGGLVGFAAVFYGLLKYWTWHDGGGLR